MPLLVQIVLFLFLSSWSICQEIENNVSQRITDKFHSVLYKNLELEDVSSSYCDLTTNYCDINCCSDQDCSEEDKSAFECGKQNFRGRIPGWRSSECSGALAGLLCVYRENSFFIGDIFNEENVIREGGPERVRRRLRKAHYFQTDLPQEEMEEDVPFTGYRYGRPIPSLVLPHNPVIPGGYCTRSLPVRYLIDRVSTCFLDVSSYSCPELGRKATGRLRSGYLDETLEIKVRSRKSQVVRPYVIFASSGCGYFSSGEPGCRDAVVSAEYLLEWNGTVLVSVEASFLTVDVPAAVTDCTGRVYLKQSYTVRFKHASTNYTAPDEGPLVTNSLDKGYAIGDALVFV